MSNSKTFEVDGKLKVAVKDLGNNKLDFRCFYADGNVFSFTWMANQRRKLITLLSLNKEQLRTAQTVVSAYQRLSH